MILACLLDPRTFKKVVETGITIYTFFNVAFGWTNVKNDLPMASQNSPKTDPWHPWVPK